ncbi:hypothetical protein GCM10022255_011740 [Dactylosporangium darangshiense]|uniref:Uncharacterized protein n=1 Tax=Dactylosporangium darangshiense TaxID=579108 RepID=A0ABP8CZ92_9ACTN
MQQTAARVGAVAQRRFEQPPADAAALLARPDVQFASTLFATASRWSAVQRARGLTAVAESAAQVGSGKRNATFRWAGRREAALRVPILSGP